MGKPHRLKNTALRDVPKVMQKRIRKITPMKAPVELREMPADINKEVEFPKLLSKKSWWKLGRKS
jgi:hypothetical protein